MLMYECEKVYQLDLHTKAAEGRQLLLRWHVFGVGCAQVRRGDVQTFKQIIGVLKFILFHELGKLCKKTQLR